MEYKEFNGYDLSRNWFNFCFENPEKVKPIHTAIFFFAVEHCNRLGGKEKFGFPSQMTMDAIGVKKYQTYGKALNEISDWGFIKFIERSKNQYSANIISINGTPKKGIARGKALDKAFIKHGSKQGKSIGQGMDSINKPLTNKPLTNKPEREKRFSPPTLVDVKNKISERNYKTFNAESFWNFYESKNWMVGKNKMKDWEKALAGWESRSNESKQKPSFSINR